MLKIHLPWHFYSAVFGVMAPFQRERLPEQVLVDVEGENREVKQLIVHVLRELLVSIQCQQKSFDEALGPPGSATVVAARASILQTGPAMIAEGVSNGDEELVDHGISLVFNYLTSPDAEDSKRTALLANLASSSDARIRAASVKLLAKLAIYWRCQESTQNTTAEQYATLLRFLLQRESLLPTLMSVAYVALGQVAVQHTSSLPSGDTFALCAAHGSLHIVQHAVDRIDPRLWWDLYWGLRAAETVTHCHAAQQARHCVACIMQSIDLSNPGGSDMPVWHNIMEDPYPPIALVGSQQLLRISGIDHYDKYEAAIGDAQRSGQSETLKCSYLLAMTIWERVEGDGKQH